MEKNPQIREGIISQIQKRGGNRKNGFAAPLIDFHYRKRDWYDIITWIYTLVVGQDGNFTFMLDT